MNALPKTLGQGAAVFVAGAIGWLAVVSMTLQSAPSPTLLVALMTLYIIGFTAAAFTVHMNTVAGLPFEDANEHRRPSLVIPVVSSIALMIFVVGYVSSHPTIWIGAA